MSPLKCVPRQHLFTVVVYPLTLADLDKSSNEELLHIMG